MKRHTNHDKRLHADGDSLTAYLEEIGKYAVQSRDAELELAARIRAGDPRALETLVCANLRFVVLIAKQYQHRGVSLPDLVAEGNLGLVRAAERFDPERGVKFISYGVWWVRQALLQTLADNGHIMRIPIGQAGAMRRIGRGANQLSQELGREPTQRELAELLGLEESDIALALPVARESVSLDAPLADDREGRLLDILPDDVGAAPDAASASADLSASLHAAMAVLRGREPTVLTMYFGLDGEEPRTLEDIGATMGITRERVRQIKDKGLLRIRRSRQARALEAFRQGV